MSKCPHNLNSSNILKSPRPKSPLSLKAKYGFKYYTNQNNNQKMTKSSKKHCLQSYSLSKIEKWGHRKQ
jgi:hypothetical protein